MLFIAPIVEGHGEVEAVPALLHRIAMEEGAQTNLRVNKPIRVKAGRFLQNEDYFQKLVTAAAAKAAQFNGVVLILLDCEDDCPARVGPELLARARAVRGDVDVLVALAFREYETWFLASAVALRGRRGLSEDLVPPNKPEAIRDAKGWLGARMDCSYDPVIHQLEFTRRLDIREARKNLSFDRLCRHIIRLLHEHG